MTLMYRLSNIPNPVLGDRLENWIFLIVSETPDPGKNQSFHLAQVY